MIQPQESRDSRGLQQLRTQYGDHFREGLCAAVGVCEAAFIGFQG